MLPHKVPTRGKNNINIWLPIIISYLDLMLPDKVPTRGKNNINIWLLIIIS
jgi:hypothetical protein